MTTYATADTHFGHKLMAKDRGFIDFEIIDEKELDESEINEQRAKIKKSIRDMDNKMIESWNEVVDPQDTVWHLGDFAFNKKHAYYLQRLNGHIHIVLGNHDLGLARMSKFPFASAQELKYLKHNDTKIFMLHYPCRSWRGSYHGSIHFHGHSHGHAAPYENSIDVGVDCWDLKPVSFDFLIEKLKVD